MPAAKSRNRLPSMSSTVSPSPRTGTIGYARGRLGDVHVSSNATWARAFEPGSTLTTMALLGAGSMYFDPASGDFDRVVKLATPLAIILALIAWSPAASRIGR